MRRVLTGSLNLPIVRSCHRARSSIPRFIFGPDCRSLRVYDVREKTAVNAAAHRKGCGALAFWTIGFCVPCMDDETAEEKESHGLYSLKGYFLRSSLPRWRTSCTTDSILAITAPFAQLYPFPIYIYLDIAFVSYVWSVLSNIIYLYI